MNIGGLKLSSGAPLLVRVILAICVLKTIQVTFCKANGDINAVVIESKCFKQLLNIKVYGVAYLNFINSRDVQFPISIK
jgi:hypothetical protein